MKRGNDWTGISNSIIIEKGIYFSSLSKAFLKRSPENTFDRVPYIYLNILLSFLGRTDGIYSHQGSTQVQILGDLNGVYCQSRYRTDRDVEVNPKLPNALRGALSAGCLYQRKILPTRLPDNIHVLIRKAALPALFRGSVREGDPFSIPYRDISPWSWRGFMPRMRSFHSQRYPRTETRLHMKRKGPREARSYSNWKWIDWNWIACCRRNVTG